MVFAKKNRKNNVGFGTHAHIIGKWREMAETLRDSLIICVQMHSTMPNYSSWNMRQHTDNTDWQFITHIYSCPRHGQFFVTYTQNEYEFLYEFCLFSFASILLYSFFFS